MKHIAQPAETNRVVAAGFVVALLAAFYALVLAIGLLTLPDASQPIDDPWFTLMELLILVIAPSMVVFTVGARYLAPPESQAEALLAIIFMGMCAAVTSVVHFAILTLSHLPTFENETWQSMVFGFRWPSLAYALDILAWDIFFPLSAAFTAISLRRSPELGLERTFIVIAALLSLAGLVGVPLANMEIRSIGVVGYVVFYPIAAAMIALNLWRRERGIVA